MERFYCRDCACLVEGENGKWICDEKGMEIEIVKRCPETGEASYDTRVHYGPSNPWDAPGMKISDFI